MALYTFQAGATTYAIGFIWQSGHGRAATLARQNSRAVGYDVYCAIPAPNGTSTQIGLSQAGVHLRRVKHTTSLAAALALTGNSLHAVVTLDKSRSYHCAIRAGEVLAAGDVIGSATNIDIIEQEHNEMAGLDQATHYSLQEFLTLVNDRLRTLPKNTKVHRVPSNGVIAKRVLSVGVPLVALIVVVSYMHYLNSQAAAKAAAARALVTKAQALERSKLQAAHRQVTRAQHSHPWASIAPPGNFSSACRKPFRELRWSIDGWIIKNWLCFAGLDQTTAHYAPGIGAGVSTLAPPLKYLRLKEASVYLPTNETALGMRRDELPSSLLESHQFMTRIYSVLDAMGVSGALHLGSTHATPQFYTSPRGVKIALTWSRFDFTIKTDGLPWAITRALGTIPGVRINQFTLVNQMGTLHWTLNGVAYVQTQ